MKIDNLGIDEVIDLADYLEKDVYAKRNERFRLDERFYDLDFKSLLHIPDQFYDDTLVLSTGRDMIDTYCNHTNITNASIKATRKGAQKKSDEEEKMERHFAAGVLYMTNLETEVSPWWDCAKHYWLHGMGVMKSLYVADLWPNKPSQKKGESDDGYQERLNEWLGETGKAFPIKVMSVHPYNVYPDPDPLSTDFVIEINQYHWFKARQRYPFWGNPEGRGNLPDKGQQVRHITYWSATQHMEIVDGESVIRTRSKTDNHGYGLVPYVIFNSGLGSLTHDVDMSKRYVGLLRYVMDVLVAESSSFSVNYVVLKKAAWTKKAFRGPKEAIMASQITDDYGTIDQLAEGVEYIEYQHAVPPAESMQHFQMLHGLLAEHGAPRTMQGMGEEGVRSGSDRRLMIAEASQRLGQSEQTFQNRTAKVLENCARIFKNVVPGNVRVWSRDAIPSFDMMIDKKKMKEPFNYSVQFSPLNQEDEYRRHDDKIKLKQAQIYDNTKVWEEMPGLDVDDMAERLERQRIMDDPGINQTISETMSQMVRATLAKKLGSDAMLQNRQEQEQGQQSGQTGVQQPTAGMTQGVPNIAAPGSSQEIENQIKARQGANPMRFGQGMGGGGERGSNR